MAQLYAAQTRPSNCSSVIFIDPLSGRHKSPSRLRRTVKIASMQKSPPKRVPDMGFPSAKPVAPEQNRENLTPICIHTTNDLPCTISHASTVEPPIPLTRSCKSYKMRPPACRQVPARRDRCFRSNMEQAADLVWRYRELLPVQIEPVPSRKAVPPSTI